MTQVHAETEPVSNELKLSQRLLSVAAKAADSPRASNFRYVAAFLRDNIPHVKGFGFKCELDSYFADAAPGSYVTIDRFTKDVVYMC